MAKKQPTRERILDTALALFNDRRYGTVTTAGLASEIGIAEGNLWYHFNDRQALLEGLLERFATQVDKRLAIQPGDGSALQEYISYYRLMAEEIQTYRFFYRDQADYGPLIGPLSDRLPGLYRQTADQFRGYFKKMREQGYLKVEDDALDLLITNILIIFRYYLEFAREAGLPEQAGSGAVRRAFRLHLGLFEERLTADAKTYLHTELGLDDLTVELL